MTPRNVFRGHYVICGWNKRGSTIISALRCLVDTPILVVNEEITQVMQEVQQFNEVYTLQGDCTQRHVLLAADVSEAKAVLVLAPDQEGSLADARSVKIALAVERIRTAVYTIVEVRDIQNKSHFTWTKVDDLITSDEISVRMIAQAVRHTIDSQSLGDATLANERKFLKVYGQMVNPHQTRSQLFRAELDWRTAQQLCWGDLLSQALPLRVVPLALVGYLKHSHDVRGIEWESWKTDTVSNPSPKKRFQEIWSAWPEGYTLGVLMLAPGIEAVSQFASRFAAHPTASSVPKTEVSPSNSAL
ncbi:MAG: NAD-binding protein [Bdellovibrionales bacterium]|nr:NAD-binding protein [Bdellovibrionales bacterium]